MSTSAKLLLLVEDSEDDADIFLHVYRRGGFPYRLEIARDGAQALDYVFGNAPYSDRSKYPFPDLVLLDLRLPKIPGFEVLKAIRAAPEVAQLPVIILSSSNQETDMKRAQELGANGYQVKPSHPAGLHEALSHLCQQWLG